MSDRIFVRAVWVAVGGLAGSILSALALAAAGGPEAVLSRGYANALSDVDTVWEQRLSGNLWLSDAPAGAGSLQARPLQSNPLRHALGVGDRIKIAARSGNEETIEVVGLEQVDGGGLGMAGLQFQIVTGRLVGDASGETVRFLFAVDATRAAPAAAPVGRSL